jgi:hypothetical protein
MESLAWAVIQGLQGWVGNGNRNGSTELSDEQPVEERQDLAKAE